MFGTKDPNTVRKKQLIKLIRTCGRWSSDAKACVNNYGSACKNYPVSVNHYHQVRDDAKKILSDCRELEDLLYDHEQPDPAQKRRLTELLAELRKSGKNMDFEFVISKADTEFHSTLDAILRIGPDYLNGKADRLLFQSEVENLTALTREGLDKEKPDPFALAVFYLKHTDRELEEMSYSMRLDYVAEHFESEFRTPFLKLLTETLGSMENLPDKKKEKAEKLLRELTAATDLQETPSAEQFLQNLTDRAKLC